MEASQAFAGRHRPPSIAAADRPPIAGGLSVILIATADGSTTASAIAEARAVIRSVTENYEILVVPHNTCADQGCPAAAVANHSDSKVRMLAADGLSAPAWQRGLRQAKHPWVVVAEAGGGYHLGELRRLLPLARDFDAVCGYRIDRSRDWLAWGGRRSGAIISGVLLRTGARDPACGMKLFRRSFLDELPDLPDDAFAEVELLARLRLAGAEMVEVGVSFDPSSAVAAGWGADWGQAVSGAISAIVGAYRWSARLMRFWWSQSLFPAAVQAPSDDAHAGDHGNAIVWRGKRALAAWCVLAAAALVFFFGHLSYPLLEPDESRYARIAQEMIRSGDYLVPRRFGEPYLDKPPLLYWLTAASYGLFGVSAAAARVVCSLAGMATVLITYALGRRFVGQRAAWIGAFMLMLCAGFALGGKFLIMDGLLTCFVTLAMFSGFLAIHGPRVRPAWCVAASLFCGLGMMTKGPLAIVLFLPPLFASRWLTGSGARLTWRHWGLCLLPGVLLALPWFVLISLRQPDFLEHFLWRHHIARFTTDFIHEEPWWYYIPVLVIGMFPATLLLGPLAVLLFGADGRLRPLRTREMGYLLLAAAWTLAFFSMSRGKLPPYIIPVLPPLCLLCGRLLDLLLEQGIDADFFARTRRYLPEFVCSVGLLGSSVLGIVDLAFGGGRDGGFLIDGALVVAGISLFVVLARGGFLKYRHRWSTAGALAWTAMAYAFLNLYPDVAYNRSIATQAQRICNERGNPNMPVVFFGRREESLLFYLPPERLYTFSGKEQARLATFLRRQPHALVVSDRRDIAELLRSVSDGLTIDEVGGRGHLFVSQPARSSVASGSSRQPN